MVETKTAKQVCKDLEIPYYRLDYLIRKGIVPEPSRSSSGQRIFSEEHIAWIRSALARRGGR